MRELPSLKVIHLSSSAASRPDCSSLCPDIATGRWPELTHFQMESKSQVRWPHFGNQGNFHVADQKLGKLCDAFADRATITEAKPMVLLELVEVTTAKQVLRLLASQTQLEVLKFAPGLISESALKTATKHAALGSVPESLLVVPRLRECLLQIGDDAFFKSIRCPALTKLILEDAALVRSMDSIIEACPSLTDLSLCAKTLGKLAPGALHCNVLFLVTAQAGHGKHLAALLPVFPELELLVLHGDTANLQRLLTPAENGHLQHLKYLCFLTSESPDLA